MMVVVRQWGRWCRKGGGGREEDEGERFYLVDIFTDLLR